MREIKFRAWNKRQNKMVYANLNQAMNTLFYSWIDTENIMQYTGLRDSTKWEQLTKEEKQQFYNEHRSEDGETIKYQHIDDVKRLWKGKEIYEGDIVKVKGGVTAEVIFAEYPDFQWLLRWIGAYEKYYPFGQECKVIGNIYDNPELLGGDGV